MAAVVRVTDFHLCTRYVLVTRVEYGRQKERLERVMGCVVSRRLQVNKRHWRQEKKRIQRESGGRGMVSRERPRGRMRPWSGGRAAVVCE